ncbi:hypothetical protein HKBW3S33_00307 [Candidatus Hakubella thermalkaliphila]|uniref:Glycosyltransferase RgtA/B/C/D-like domain-containing protein n=1 Tax=Candidatus Hakubella thermalkaliphila TaxID=2754717 RepID=A0A6V8P3Q7_9ACTN|nr:hypothetical protein HKBW3S33_00307 [Candidatus Hakubella thermalkaliphila]
MLSTGKEPVPEIPKLQTNKTKSLPQVVFYILAILTFLLLGFIAVGSRSDPGTIDTTAYLRESLYFKENGGLPNALSLLLSGRYRQANQHPLYLLLLSLVASRDISFYPKAKLLTLAIGVVTFIFTFLTARKLFGERVGMLSAIFLLFNQLFMSYTTIVAAESLLALFFLLSWLFMAKGFENNKYFIYAGVFSGLAYLTKGSGLLLIPSFGLSSLLVYRLKVLKNKYFWSYFLFFFLSSFPLIVRNIVVYRNPFYNINNYVMWFDYYEQFFIPGIWQNPPTLLTYLQSHSLAFIYERFIFGIRGQAQLFIRALNSYSLVPLYELTGLVIMLLFIVGLYHLRNRGIKMFSLIITLTFFVLFSWYYYVVPNTRFLVPLIPMISVIASLSLSNLIQLSPRKLITVLPYLLIVALVFTAGIALYSEPIQNPFTNIEFADGYFDLLNWMKANIKEGDVYILGPTHSYNFEWHSSLGGRRIDFPLLSSYDEWEKFSKDNNVVYVILEKQILERRKDILGNYFSYEPEKGLVMLKEMEGWRIAFKDQREPTSFLVLRRSEDV